MRTRRDFLNLAAAVCTLPTATRAAAAAAYPSRAVRILVGFAAGGAADLNARLIGRWLSPRLGQQFIVENRVGAGGNIATEEVVRAAPDGYTLLNCASANTINATLYSNLKFSFIRDIAPVAGSQRLPNVLLLNPSVPAKTVRELIAYAKAHPGDVNFGSAGTGTAEHLAGEMFKMMTGVEMTHVPYRGGAQALTALLAGQVQVYFCVTSTALAGIKSGMRPLAVTTSARWEGLPDVPAVSESVPGYEVSTWFGIGAPRQTPAEIIAKLNTEINAALADSEFKGRLKAIGAVPMPMTAEEFGAFIVKETEKWAKVIRAANIAAG
jgi:tripartite-type tricarboxylate transporter receptor subunit TctC